MNPRKRLVPLLPALGLLLASAGPAPASLCSFDDVAIFATNSIRLGTGVAVETGDVVANNASPGPFLDEGVELALDRNATVAGSVKADSVDLDNGATFGGLECNNGHPTCSGLGLPVFPTLPPFQEAQVREDCDDVVVPAGTTEILGNENPRKTCFGDITIEQGATLLFSGGGGFDVRSIGTATTAGGQCPSPCRSIEFDAPTDLRVEGRFDSERRSFVGPADGSGIAASDIAIYVDGQNGLGGGLFELPRAANVGRESAVQANFYAPNGTFELERGSTMTGAALARDVQIDKDSTVNLDSAFVNGPPTADDKEVFTDGQAEIIITLTGSDPEGGDLDFAIVSNPQAGTLGVITPIIPAPVGRCSISGISCGEDADCLPDGGVCQDFQQQAITAANVTYTPSNSAANAFDEFDYTATDDCGLVSAAATVEINPPGDATIPPDDPIAVVDASDVFAETTTNTSVTIALDASAPGFCSTSGTVCEDVEDGNPETIDSTDCPLNQDGNPATSELCIADPLTFSIESLPSGSLADPVDGAITTVPTDLSGSTVIYTPPLDFTSGICTNSGDLCEVDADCLRNICSISGDLCEADPDCLPDGGTCIADSGTCIPPVEFDFSVTGAQGGSDAATVFVNIFAAEELAEDISVAASVNTPVKITLKANLGGAGTPGAGPLTAPPETATTTGLPSRTGTGSSSSLGATQLQALGPIQAQQQGPRIDFGVTPDDSGNANACGATPITITTEYVETQSIVFGTEVSFPLAVTIPDVVIRNDSAAFPLTCRSNGVGDFAPFAGDWWAQFRAGTAPSVAGDPAGVNSFSVDVGFIDSPDDGITDLFAYDLDGNVIDQASTTATGGSFQVLTVSDPNSDKQIAFVHVNSSDDPAGLSIDFLDYDEPAAIGTPIAVTYTIESLPSGGSLTSGGVAVFAGQTFTVAPTLVYTAASAEEAFTTTFNYSVTEGQLTDTAIVTIFVDLFDNCTPVGRNPGCAPGGGGQAPQTQGSQEALEAEVARGPSRGLTIEIQGAGGSVSTSSVPLSGDRMLMGLSCGGAECNKVMPEGAEVTLFARPDGEHFEFLGWGGDCWGSDPITTVTLSEHTRCTAEFGERAPE